MPHIRTTRAYIALGGNMGDTIDLIEKACQAMNDSGVTVRRTSHLYKTAPMYVEDQDPFINGVAEVDTSLSPIALLDTLQAIELSLNRQRIIDKGPRTIDLDIVLYGDEVIHNERLDVPHKLMLEREFVLRPLCDLIPKSTLPRAIKALTSLSFRNHLDNLPISFPRPSIVTRISHDFGNLTPTNPSRQTHIMAILNVTPDSFSDGGVNFSHSPSSLKSHIKTLIDQGATIIDIGGQSSRPGAPEFTPEEELARVLPAIKTIRSMPEAKHIAISIDTYRASVASAAITAGADIINDISAGLLDPEMLPTMARLGCTVCLMHMRGTPHTMTKLTSYPNGVVEGVANELLDRVREAQEAGIKPWRIILDPGVGFAKTQAQNLTLIRDLARLRAWPGLEGYAWLMGTSRKGFIGKITGEVEARERVFGTAATVAASVSGGADVVRVHDVKEMSRVAKMADAIWRVEGE